MDVIPTCQSFAPLHKGGNGVGVIVGVRVIVEVGVIDGVTFGSRVCVDVGVLVGTVGVGGSVGGAIVKVGGIPPADELVGSKVQSRKTCLMMVLLAVELSGKLGMTPVIDRKLIEAVTFTRSPSTV